MHRLWTIIVASLAMLLPPAAAWAAAEPQPVHGIAMHGKPKYGPDFSHFDYTNPNAPKGGTIRLAVQGTFDSFNPFIPKGNPAAGVAYETLLVGSADEPFSEGRFVV